MINTTIFGTRLILNAEPSVCIFYSVLCFMWIIFIWEAYLAARQSKIYRTVLSIPRELNGILDTDTFEKARTYQLDKADFDFYARWYSQFESMFILLLGGIPWLWKLSGTVIARWGYSADDEIKQTMVFVLLGSIFSTIMDLPWSTYYTFVVEQKHGFNKQTPGFYAKDRVKKFFVMQGITMPIVAALVFIVHQGGDYFFVYVWLFTVIISLFLMTIYPDFIAPLFDKYNPLPDGDLRTRIEHLAASIEFPLTKLYVVEGSKRSSHSNAYFYGFFKNKRIVLFDTLLEDYTPLNAENVKSESTNGDVTEEKTDDAAVSKPHKKTGCNTQEVLAVLAHELGHWKFNHVAKNLIFSQVNLFACFMVFGLLYKSDVLYDAFGFHNMKPTIVGLLIIFQFIFSPYNTVMSFIMTIVSRRFEFQADEFARSMNKEAFLRSALIKLNKDNLGFPLYDHLYSVWHHSHPPLLERLDALKHKAQ